MAGTINYDFDPGQIVWVIDEESCENMTVRQATIVQVRGNVLTTSSTVKYDVRYGTDAGTKEVLEDNIFATLGDAMTEYEDRLS